MKWLLRQYELELEAKVENGEITEEEASQLLLDWEGEWGNIQYDIAKDRKLEKDYDED